MSTLMNVLGVVLTLIGSLFPLFAFGQDGIVAGPGRVSEAPAAGHYQVRANVDSVTVYAQPPGDNPPDCNANPSACLAIVVPSGEMIDCNQAPLMCDGQGNLASRDPVARVHYSYWENSDQCDLVSHAEKWCDRNNHFFQKAETKINSGTGYIFRREVDPLPYRDAKNKLVKWGDYDSHGPDLKALNARADKAEGRLKAADHPNPKNQTTVTTDTGGAADAGNADVAGCTQCALAADENKSKLVSEAREAESKSYEGDGCEKYPFTLGCSAQARGNGFGFLAHLAHDPQGRGAECAICFTQQVVKGDFCGDPQTMPIYKLESMSAMLVKKSGNLCKAAAQQFSKVCSPWKTNGTIDQRKDAVRQVDDELIKSFAPDLNKVIKKDAKSGDRHLKKSPYLTANLMECLSDREDTTADPAIPNYTLCNDTQYQKALAAARQEVKDLKRQAQKSKSPDYEKIKRADAELHTFENQNDSGPHDRPYALSALNRYHGALSSATGLDMVTRSTLHWLSDNIGLYENQCGEFKGYWSNIEHVTSDAKVKPFFGNHQCKQVDSGNASNPNSGGDTSFAERLFGLKSKDPTVQLEVRIETVNYLLNVADPGGNKSKESTVRHALRDWFGGVSPDCFVNEVFACSTCMDHKGGGDKSCLELTHPTKHACQSVSAIVNNQVQNLRAKAQKNSRKQRNT